MDALLIKTLVDAARDLATADEANPEYDRALCELVGTFLPGEREDRMTYLYPLITGRPYLDTPALPADTGESAQDPARAQTASGAARVADVAAMRRWMAEARLALDAATTIAERVGAGLNLANHDRLSAEARDILGPEWEQTHGA